MNDVTDYFKRQLEFANGHNRFKDCPYYPCHEIPEGQEGLNCLFCYCPFYPCGIENRGGKWIEDRMGEKVWDCTGCNLVHRDGTVVRITGLFYQGLDAEKINKSI
jgi:Zn-finger protein